MSTIDDLMSSQDVQRSAQVLALSHLVIFAQSPFVQVVPLAAAAVKGFCDAAQIPLGAAGPALLVAPIAAAGSFGMAAGALSSDMAAVQLETDPQRYRMRSVGFGGGVHCATAAVCTLLGYGIGYGAYSLMSMLGR